MCPLPPSPHLPRLPPPLPPPTEDLLNEAVHAAAAQRLVRPHDFVVCLKSVRGNSVVKVVQVRGVLPCCVLV